MKNNYPKPIIIMHWITFALVAMVYLTAGDPTITDWKGQIHVAGGILIFIYFS
jgi:cytochrome b561